MEDRQREVFCDLFRRCVHGGRNDDWGALLGGRQRERLRRLASAALREGGFSSRPFDVDDLEQEVYCRLLRPAARLFRGTSDGEAWAWLARVAQRIVATAVRRELADRRAVAGAEQAAVWLRPRGAPDPEESLLRREGRQRFLDECAGSGPLRRRALKRRVVELAFIEGCSSRDIAARVGLEPSGVDAIVTRMRRTLRASGYRLPRRAA